MVESQASSELYGLLKRSDEKFITERAYDNPKFVEDVVRDVAGAFNARCAHHPLQRQRRELRIHPQPFRLRAHQLR